MNIIPYSLGSLIRFLIGIFLLQGVTVLLVYTALNTDWLTTWPLFALLGGAIGVLVALWFNTIIDADRHRAVSRASERFSKEREKIRIKAEQQRAKDGRSQERLAAKVRSRGAFGASVKTSLAVGGVVGVGTAMILTQFVTLGLITVSAAGGVALGYGVRARQEKLLANRRLAAEERALNAIDLDQPARVLPRRRGKGDR